MALHILIHLQSTWPSQTPVDRCLQPHRPSRHWRGGDPGPQGVRVWLAVGRTDMRKGKNGLALQFQERLQCPDGLAELQKIFWGAGRTDVIRGEKTMANAAGAITAISEEPKVRRLTAGGGVDSNHQYRSYERVSRLLVQQGVTEGEGE